MCIFNRLKKKTICIHVDSPTYNDISTQKKKEIQYFNIERYREETKESLIETQNEDKFDVEKKEGFKKELIFTSQNNDIEDWVNKKLTTNL